MQTIQTLFERQRESLNHFFQSVDLAELERLVETVRECTGSVILSGVGKSGLIAQKIAATLISTGTAAHYLSPAHALHGDLGLVGPNDVFLAFSKSGESQELLDLLPYVQKKGAKTIAVVSKKGSRLERTCDQAIHLPVQRELCPYDLAPTTSAVIQLLFGDLLAISLMEAKRFSVDDFAANHPAGLLGRKITLRVADRMLKGEEIPFCQRTDRLIDVLHELSGKRCGCLLVVDGDKKLLGIFTDGDLRRAVQENGPKALDLPLELLMSQNPKSIKPNCLAHEAIRVMEEGHPVTVLPVLEAGIVVGLLRMHDILQSNL